MTPCLAIDRHVSADISWDLLSIPFESLPELEPAAPPPQQQLPGESPYGREWGWDSELMAVRRDEAPVVRCGEPWSIHNTLGFVPPQLAEGLQAAASSSSAAAALLAHHDGASKADPAPAQAGMAPAKDASMACAGRRGPKKLVCQIRCQVPDCTSDLLAEREFNLRNKICEFHQKANVLVIDGEEMRFCQQCTKLHPIAMFDGNKRGCRVRLNKHAKRRRLAGLISKGLTAKARSSGAGPTAKTPTLSGASQESKQKQTHHPKDEEASSAISPDDGAPAPSEGAVRASASPSLSEAADVEPHISAPPRHQTQPIPLSALPAGVSEEEFQRAAAFGYDAVQQCVTNFSLKMIGSSPDQLPGNLKEELQQWMASTPVALQGYIRFGCLHLSVDVTLENTDQAAAAAASLPAGFAASVQSRQQRLPWCTNPTTAYFPRGVEVAAAGTVVRSGPHSAARPRILGLRDAAVSDGLVHIAAVGLRHTCAKLLARLNNEFHELEIQALQTAENGVDLAAIRIPYQAGAGFAWIELLQDAPEGFEISEPVPLLVTDCELIASEVSRVRGAKGTPHMDRNSLVKLLQDLALLLHPTPGRPPVAEDTCLRLAGFAASCGWPETLDRALDRALQTMGLEDALELIHAGHSRLTLLSAAVTSGSTETVSRVLSFMAETGSFELAEVDYPAGAFGMSPMQWAEARGVQEIVDMMSALRKQGRNKAPRTATQDSPASAQAQDPDAADIDNGPDPTSSAGAGSASVIPAQSIPRWFAPDKTSPSSSVAPPRG